MTLEEIKAFLNTEASKETIAEIVMNEMSINEEFGYFNPHDHWGGNADDTYEGGIRDGSILAFRELKEMFDKLV